MKHLFYPSFLVAFLFMFFNMQAQTSDSLAQLTLSLEYRPRTEWRHGYRKLPSNTDRAAFFTSHRARFNLELVQKNFRFYASVQDIRIWGEEDTRNTVGTTQFFEVYAEPQINDNWSVRIGRQRISLDDERFFAQNEWRQTAGKHDAVRVMFRNNQLEMDFFGGYNQSQIRNFGTAYDISWDFYKVLGAHYLNWTINKKVSFMALNFADGYEDPDNPLATHFKYTNGGKGTLKLPFATFTVAGFYQHGKIETGEPLRAWYVDPQISFSVNKAYKIKAGIQIFSGDNNQEDGLSKAFLAQYGAFHRYNGRMDYTQKTVRTYNHEGIVNPYIIQQFKLSPRLRLIWESHLLGSQTPVAPSGGVIKKGWDTIYGWENDFRILFSANDYTRYEFGYMFMRTTDTLTDLPTGSGGNPTIIPQFAYLMVTWTPQLYRRQVLPR